MSTVTDIVNYLNEAKVFYFTSVDGDKPKVRPFGWCMEYGGKIYFTTKSDRPVYAELQKNPHFEASVMHPTKPLHWIRVSGRAVFDATTETKARAFELMPTIREFYKTPDNPDFIMFGAEDAEVILYEEQGRRTMRL